MAVKGEIEWRHFALMDNAVSGSHGLFNENPSGVHGMPPYELLVREDPENPKIIQAATIALGCPP